MSILDKIENSQVDVRNIIVENDILDDSIILSPQKYKYLFVIPFWSIEIEHLDVPIFKHYIKNIDLLFRAFTSDYQICARNVFPENSDLEYLDFTYFGQLNNQDILPEHLPDHMNKNGYSGIISVQFNVDEKWTYKKIYRFLCSIVNTVVRYEDLQLSPNGKELMLYRCGCIEENQFWATWSICVMNTSISKLKEFVDVVPLDKLSTDSLVNKVYSQTRHLVEMYRFFDKHNRNITKYEMADFKTHIYNSIFRRTKNGSHYKISVKLNSEVAV